MDPLPTIGSAYAYVGNRPTTLIDPTGLAGEPSSCGSIKCWLKDWGPLNLPHCSVKAGVTSYAGRASQSRLSELQLAYSRSLKVERRSWPEVPLLGWEALVSSSTASRTGEREPEGGARSAGGVNVGW